MKFAGLSGGALLLGLIVGCSGSGTDENTAATKANSVQEPDWAHGQPSAAEESVAGVQPFPEEEEMAAADETAPAIKPIPEDSNAE
jgi:hypothetical protein